MAWSIMIYVYLSRFFMKTIKNTLNLTQYNTITIPKHIQNTYYVLNLGDIRHRSKPANYIFTD